MYGKKNKLTTLLFKTLLGYCTKDPYQLLNNIKGVSYVQSWLAPITQDLLFIVNAARIDLKLRCCGGLSALNSFEKTIYSELW